MPYDQREAFRRFDGLLRLWIWLHDRIKDEEVTTQSAQVDLAQEAGHLIEAFGEEIAMYEGLDETPYQPTLDTIMDIQQVSICVSRHLNNMQNKLDNIDRGKAAFTEMLGTSSKKERVWN